MRIRSLFFACSAALAALSHATPSHACGGTFCSAPTPAVPAPMPVDQKGENILFSVRNGHVEAHIQIQYSGDPRYFGWVIPVPKAPEFRVGSQALFDALLASTVPTFDKNGFVFDQCASSSSSGSSGCGSSDSDFTTAGASSTPGSTGGTPGAMAPPTVEKQRVGAFDVAVLTGGTVAGVTEWLTTNALQVDPKADAVLQEYLDKGHVFVAVKLASGAGLDEIHPIVVEYEGAEPCIPIKLTAIAAKEDMVIRAFFLGEGRWVPDNYKHVIPNETKFDWQKLGSNYTQVVARAVDAEAASGQAFVTDFVGRPSVVTQSQRQLIAPSGWNSTPFYTATATNVVTLLNAQGLMNCTSQSSCTANHALVFPLLEKWLPVPSGLSPSQFYSNLSFYAKNTVFSATSFASDLEKQVIEPGVHAVALLDSAITLTRLVTALSPSEMTLDPTFIERAELPDVSQTHSATRHRTCDAKQGVALRDGREVYDVSTSTPSTNWPVFPGTSYAERVEQWSATGDAVVLRDNKAEIDASVKAFNDAQSWPPPPALDVADGSSSDGCTATSKRAVRPFALGLFAAALALVARRLRRVR